MENVRRIIASMLVVVMLLTTLNIPVFAQEYEPETKEAVLAKTPNILRTKDRGTAKQVTAKKNVFSIGSLYEDTETMRDDGNQTATGPLLELFELDGSVPQDDSTGRPNISTVSQMLEQFPYTVSGTTCTITIDKDFNLVYNLRLQGITIDGVTIDEYVIVPKGIRTIHFMDTRNGEIVYTQFYVTEGIKASFGTASMGTDNQLILDGGGDIQYENGKFVNKGRQLNQTCILNRGVTTIYDGITVQNFCSKESAIILNAGTMEIKHCKMIHNWQNCDGGANTFTDGLFGMLVNANWEEDTKKQASLTIHDITMYDNLSSASYIGNYRGIVTMHDGEVIAAKSDTYKKWYDGIAFTEGIESYSGTFTMKNGKITGFWENIVVIGTEGEKGKFYLQGGELAGYGYPEEPLFTSTNTGVSVSNYCEAVVSGGSMTHLANGIVANFNATLTMTGGTLDIDLGSCGVQVLRGSTATISGGLIKGFVYGIYTYYEDGSTVVLKDGARIEDCDYRGVHNTYGNTLQMDGGLIDSCGDELFFGGKGNYDDMYRGAGIMNGGECTINGGTIQNCLAQYGAGVCNLRFDIDRLPFYPIPGTLTINGGTIQNNTAELAGGGVCNQAGMFTFNDGIIRNNKAYTGAGVSNGGLVYYQTDAVMVMNGGMICDNVATGSAGGLQNITVAYLNGGSIERNSAPFHVAINDYYGSTEIADTFILKDNVNTDTESSANVSKPIINTHRIEFDIAESEGGELTIWETYDNPIQSIIPYEISGTSFQKMEGIAIEKVSNDHFLVKVTDTSLVPAGKEVWKIIYPEIVTEKKHYKPSYDTVFSVIMTNEGPTVKLKQSGNVNVFYTDGGAEFTVTTTKGEIAGITVKEQETDNFTCTYNAETNKGIIKQKDNMPLKKDGTVNVAKLDKTIQLSVNFVEKYQPVTMTLKVAVVSKAPSVALTPASITIYPDWGNHYSDVTLYNKTTKQTDDASAYKSIVSKTAGITISKNADGSLRVKYDGKKTKRLKAEVQRENWRKPLSVTTSVKVTKPAVVLSAKTVTLNTNQIGEAAPYTVTASLNGNTVFKLVEAQVEGRNKLAKTALEQGMLQIETGEQGEIVASLRSVEGVTMKNGSYTLKVTPQLETASGKKALKAVTLTIKVTNKQPTVSFTGKARIKLSKLDDISYSTYKTKVKNVTANVIDVKLAGEEKSNFIVTYQEDGKFYITAKNTTSLKKGLKYKIPLEVSLDNGTKVVQEVKLNVVK